MGGLSSRPEEGASSSFHGSAIVPIWVSPGGSIISMSVTSVSRFQRCLQHRLSIQPNADIWDLAGADCCKSASFDDQTTLKTRRPPASGNYVQRGLTRASVRIC